MTTKKVRFGAIPKLNMPRKSHETRLEPRPERSIVRNIEEPSVKVCYKTFSEFCQCLSGLKGISNWNFKTFRDKVVLQLIEEPYLLPKFEIAVDDSLGFTVKVYGCFLPVLSASVATVLKTFGPPEAAATAKLCEMIDGFFDCLNVRSTTEHQRKRKPFLAPYTSVDDERYAAFVLNSMKF